MKLDREHVKNEGEPREFRARRRMTTETGCQSSRRGKARRHGRQWTQRELDTELSVAPYQVHSKRKRERKKRAVLREQDACEKNKVSAAEAGEKLQGRTVNACGVKCRRRTRYTAKSSGEVCAAD